MIQNKTEKLQPHTTPNSLVYEINYTIENRNFNFTGIIARRNKNEIQIYRKLSEAAMQRTLNRLCPPT